jgi:hypothetical protein
MRKKVADPSSESPERKRAYIGRRCKQCRRELELTQGEIVAMTGAENQATISNLENKGMIGDFFWNYLEFLASKGYNPNWIILEDNSSHPKKLPKAQGVRYYNNAMKQVAAEVDKGLETLVNIKTILADLKDSPPAPDIEK